MATSPSLSIVSNASSSSTSNKRHCPNNRSVMVMMKKSAKEATSRKCRMCGDRGIIVFDHSSGDELCSNCGLVLEGKVLSEEQEWRSFSSDSGGGKGSDRNRVGDTIDAWMEDGVGGTTIVGGSRRLQHLNDSTTSTNSNDRLLRASFSSLRLIAEAFSLRNNVVERAKEVTKDLLDAGQLKNRNSSINMLAITYIACREAGMTRTIKELIVYDRAYTEKELGKAINRIKKILPNRGGGNAFYNDSASQLIARYCSRLQLSMHVADVADHVARRASQVIVSSHRPNSVAAAAIFLVVQLCSNSSTASDSSNNHNNSSHQNQNNMIPKASEIAAVTGTGEHTLRLIYKDLLDLVEHLLPKEFQPTNEGGLAALRQKSRKRKNASD